VQIVERKLTERCTKEEQQGANRGPICLRLQCCLLRIVGDEIDEIVCILIPTVPRYSREVARQAAGNWNGKLLTEQGKQRGVLPVLEKKIVRALSENHLGNA
jgi:hypothetical protein